MNKSKLILLLLIFSQSIVAAPDSTNQVWEVFTNRSWITAIALSEETLWVGAKGGGLEQRNASTGQLVRVLTNLDDLPSNNINALLSDGQQGLWIGTDGGLAYRNFQRKISVYNINNSGLSSNEIRALFNDGNGGLWIGVETYGGQPGLIHRSANNDWTVYKSPELPNFSVYSLSSDDSKGLWIGTENGLVYRSASGEWTIYNTNNSQLPDNHINALSNDGSNGLWIGTENGLAYRSRQGEWTIYNPNNSDLPYHGISSLVSDSHGGVWIGTHWGGLAYRNVNGQWMIFDDPPDSRITTLLSDSREGLWIGSENGLTYRHNNNELTVYEPEQTALPLNLGTALARDSLGGLWIGTPWSGLVQYTTTSEWKYYDPYDFGLSIQDGGEGISSLLGDKQGGLWIGTGIGLAYRSVNGNWTVYQSDLPKYFIQALESDGNNGLWIGTSGGGVIHRSANGDLSVYNTDNSGLPTNHVRALATDESGGLWIGLENQGLAYRSANGEWTTTDTSALPHNEVSTLLSDGGLWVGFKDGGLAYRSLTGEWTTYNTKTSELPDNNVVALVRDNDGLWIGTNGGIAYRSTGGEWTVYNSDNSGLPNNSINAIESDGTGGIWEAGDGGLAHLSFGQKNALCTELNQANCQSLLTGKRAAIIIAGGGNELTNTLWDTTESISNYIYKLLNKRGFLNEEIYYLSPKSWADFNGDGLNDRIVDAPNDRPLTVEDIREALQWAKTRGQLDQPLYLFFIDHGGTDRFQLGKLSYMSAPEFKTILDDYQSHTSNQMVLVIDTCYSGSLMQKLITPNRAIISSTGNGLAYFDRLQKQGFSRFLASGLLKGMNFFEGFQYATQKQKQMLGNLSQSTDLNIIQEPQLEDGQNGQWLRQLFLNGPFVTADITLAIESLTISTGVQAGQSIPLKAQVGLTQGKVLRVWALMIPPKTNLVMDSNGTPILAYPHLQLSQTQDETIWETTWPGGVYNGDYEITFYAEDNQGNIASSDNTVVISVTGGVEPPPQATVEIVVAQEKYHAGEQFKAQLIENLGWGYDLFAAIVLPDGNFIALKNTNQLAALNEPTKWRGHRSQNAPLTLFDLNLPNLPKGQYCLYGILSPEKENVFETLNNWVMAQKCFEI